MHLCVYVCTHLPRGVGAGNAGSRPGEAYRACLTSGGAPAPAPANRLFPQDLPAQTHRPRVPASVQTRTFQVQTVDAVPEICELLGEWSGW